MAHQHARRIEAVRRTLRDDGIDALLVTSESNLRYLTGFTGEQTALVLAEDRAWMISDAKFVETLAEDCPELEAVIRPVGQAMIRGVAEAVAGFGLGRVGFDGGALTVAQWETLRTRAPKVEWKNAGGGRVEAIRAIKDEEELAEIREAVRQAEAAFGQVVAALRPDQSEKEAADALDAALRRAGATAAAFTPIVAAGPRAALPHARPGADRRIGDADFTLIDWGASHGPYKSDLTRMVVTGKVTPEFRSVYRTVLHAHQTAIAALKPGITAAEVDGLARRIIEEAGHGPHFTHGLGHGIGLDIHENPFFRHDNPAVLRAGMVVTVEPGIYLPGWGGVRIEDDVWITDDGPVVLTQVPRSLESAIRPW